MKGTVLAILLLNLVSIGHVFGLGVGFKTTVTQNGLNYLQVVGMEVLQQALQNLEIPSLSGDDETPIGKISWQLTSLVLSGVQLPSTSVVPLPGTGVSVAMSNLGATVNLDWHYRKDSWPHVSDHGTATVTVGGTFAYVNLHVYDAGGRPQVQVATDSLAIGSLDIKLHGGASWLYNFFIDVLHGKIKDAIQSSLQQGITNSINNGVNNALATMQITATIHNEAEINYEMTDNPTFAKNYVTLNQLGEFYEVASPQECPNDICTYSAMPDAATTEMVQMVISDFVLDSASFVYFKLNKLVAYIKDKDIPSWAPIRLNTTYFKYLIPPLYQLYPDNLLEIKVYATQAPEGTFTSSGALITALGNLEMDVVLSNGQLTPAFTLAGNMKLFGSASISGEMIIGNLSFVTTNFSLAQSEIGKFDATTLDSILNLLFSSGLVPAINEYLAQGIPLPIVQGLTFVNPTVIWGNRYMVVSTNVRYAPSWINTENKVPMRIE